MRAVKESTGREPIRVVLGPDLVSLAKKYAVDADFDREFAALAGSVYLSGGRSFYYLGRAMSEKRYDYPGLNVRFVGVPCDDKEKIWSLELRVRESDLMRGWLYFACAVSPIVKREKGEFVSCLICGYYEHKAYKRHELVIPFMQTSAPMPIIHKGVTDTGREVGWPDDLSRPWTSKTSRRDQSDGKQESRT